LIYDLQQAARISDYTAFMYGGQMVEYGATDEIFKHPKNELTEKYIIGKF
jgi:phosphate transport system ATP-binding protein